MGSSKEQWAFAPYVLLSGLLKHKSLNTNVIVMSCGRLDRKCTESSPLLTQNLLETLGPHWPNGVIFPWSRGRSGLEWSGKAVFNREYTSTAKCSSCTDDPPLEEVLAQDQPHMLCNKISYHSLWLMFFNTVFSRFSHQTRVKCNGQRLVFIMAQPSTHLVPYCGTIYDSRPSIWKPLVLTYAYHPAE